jgi:glycosyltransferase involved in cell wall biosynthesis
VLFAGYLGPHKGLDVLLRAWSMMSPGHGLRLVIAGAAGRDEQVWLDALRTEFDAVEPAPEWLGATEREQDFQRLFDRASVVAIPYRSSSPASGIVVRAMSAGRCIIGTRVPALVDAIEHDRDGILVDVEDAGTLAEQLSRLAADGSERDRLGAAAAQRAAELFDSEKFVDSLECAYAAARRDGGRR